MGSAGMVDMGEMEMAWPDNTLPMMTGFGQFGAMDMGGMFTVVKVREGIAPNDYKDPGWYQRRACINAPSPIPTPTCSPPESPATPRSRSV
jgi:hypothetical protein